MSDRRCFLKELSALSLGVAGGPTLSTLTRQRYVADPFALGVASGDPWPDGFVLWTRLAPNPLEGGGMGSNAVEVRWEVANDEGMRRVVQRGRVAATPELAHSVHVEVRGLRPDRWYWSRFMSGDAQTPPARTRTTPASNARPERFRFAFASCQHYEWGHFAAHQHLAREDVDLVGFLGDYIYESHAARPIRAHEADEPFTLDAYRNRYACYKRDEHLQAAHAACPWVVTWDDHEVENNYAALVSETGDPPREGGGIATSRRGVCGNLHDVRRRRERRPSSSGGHHAGESLAQVSQRSPRLRAVRGDTGRIAHRLPPVTQRAIGPGQRRDPGVVRDTARPVAGGPRLSAGPPVDSTSLPSHNFDAHNRPQPLARFFIRPLGAGKA